MAIQCCKGCVPPKRHTACWDHCPEYQKEKAEYEARKAAEDKKRHTDQAIYAHRSKAVEKALKHRRNSRRNYRRGGGMQQ